jgi:2-oxoisovalerate dehydrogenase E1 component
LDSDESSKIGLNLFMPLEKSTTEIDEQKLSFENFRKEVIADYELAYLSRQLSIIGRKEVMRGRAKFGIFGDGKEIAQIAFAKTFKPGDWRSGYYRDQTFMLAAGLFTADEFFAQLYGITGIEDNPSNGGRSMINHFGTRSLNKDGSWKNFMEMKNSSSDISPTAGQMPRLLGLAYASKLFRNNKEYENYANLTHYGNEVAFGTIGESATSEGHFFETINAAGVLQVPMALAIWDDGYGISVPVNFQTVKGSISEALRGFEVAEGENGILIFKAYGWDYPNLCRIFEKGVAICREKHIPVLFHISEMVQKLGHSTSGSHSRYKSPERLQWEENHDPIIIMKDWMISSGLADEAELTALEKKCTEKAREARDRALSIFEQPIKFERENLLKILEQKSCICKTDKMDKISMISGELKKLTNPIRRDNLSAAKRVLRYICSDCIHRKALTTEVGQWIERNYDLNYNQYSSFLYNESQRSALKVQGVPPVFSRQSPMIPAHELIRDNFEILFSRNPLIVTIGEDTGKLGDVNQGLEGLQEMFGENRVTDTGIRETTIIGQGIGMALRGLKPIAEIQYFDYLLYALQTLSDDLATLHWRTVGGQSAPLIIRTRGHRLEGIWHAGSPLSMVINSLRGIYICVPRNLTQAAGFYNLLLESDDPALIIEPLNGYRLRERKPDNLGDFKVPLGIPEILQHGKDITLVTYGSCVKVAQDAIVQLKDFGISVELIDVQTLLPFDLKHTIAASIRKTNRVVFFDEDFPGGATAYMLQKVLEEQNAFHYLDSEPRTITAKEHRTAYTSDGDYFSNPNAEDVFETIYTIMHEVKPDKYPLIY